MIVEVKQGKLNGFEKDGMYSFLGIPYAEAPVGDLRWRGPVEKKPWDGVRDALTFSAIAMQAPSQAIPGNDPTEGKQDFPQSEDCLYMNVWTPTLDKDAKLPVFLWFHGGASCCGSGNGRNASPEPFVKRGIVFVTMNYRLNILGFYAHPELSAESVHGVSGNYAQLDQIACLNWVIENIRQFGGDPEHIVIGGCSAGAIASQALSCSPLTEGKIVGAIVESGIGMDPTSYPEAFKVDTLEETEPRGVELMEKLGAKNIAEMRAMSYEQLIAVPESGFRRRLHFATTLGTCGDGYVLPIPSNECTMTLRNHNIPYLVGTTKDEAGGFAMFISKETFLQQTHDLYTDRIDELLDKELMESKEDILNIAKRMHTGHCAAKAFAELQANHHRKPVYVFSFSHKDPDTGTAHHGLEKIYLLDNLDEIKKAGEEDYRIAENVQEYWCNFIKYGNPNGKDNEAVCPERPEWKPYSAEERNVLDIGDVMICEEEDEDPLQTYVRSYAVKVCEERIAEENK